MSANICRQQRVLLNVFPAGIEGDIRSLPYEEDSFDVALDKGTMDALMTSKGDVWVRSKEAKVLTDIYDTFANAGPGTRSRGQLQR